MIMRKFANWRAARAIVIDRSWKAGIIVPLLKQRRSMIANTCSHWEHEETRFASFGRTRAGGVMPWRKRG